MFKHFKQLNYSSSEQLIHTCCLLTHNKTQLCHYIIWYTEPTSFVARLRPCIPCLWKPRTLSPSTTA